MSKHAFVDESVRNELYIMCAALVPTVALDAARRTLRSLRARGQRRIHFVTESDRRRRALLRAISELDCSSIVYVARHRDQVAARAALLATMLPELQSSGVSRLVLESRQGQDERDRSVIYRAVGSQRESAFRYTHNPASAEPLLWIADAVAWAWGRGGRWRARAAELNLFAAVKEVQVS